jgi:hypothetical protein
MILPYDLHFWGPGITLSAAKITTVQPHSRYFSTFSVVRKPRDHHSENLQ